ncbi:hypothetical protein D3C80_1413200 [compost metagenome]
MILGQIQCFKVVVVCLYLRTFRDLVSHADENILDFLNNPVQRMNAALRQSAARQGNVYLFSLQTVQRLLLLEGVLLGCNNLFNGAAHQVRHLADHRPLLGAQSSHSAQNLSQLTLFAQIFDTQIIQRLRIGNLLQLSQGLDLQCFQLFFHGMHCPL